MRALILANQLDRSERRIFKGLADAGIDIHLLMNPDGEAYQWVNDHGLNAQPLVCRSRIDFQARRRIRKVLESGNYHLLHGMINKPLANGLAAAHGMQLKRLAYRGTVGHLSRLDPASWMTYFHPALDKIVCISDAVKVYMLHKKIPKDRLIRIYKGHDPEWYQQTSSVTLSRWHIPADALVVSCAAAMRRVKGIRYLVDALPLIESSRPVHLLLIGEMRDKTVQRQIDRSPVRNQIHVTGHRTDAPALLGASHVTAMCSISREGLPRAVIEAMSQGVPAVVTSVGGMPELVEHEVSGLVVPPRDAGSIALALEQLANDKQMRESMGAAAATRIQTDFHIQQTVAAWKDLYLQITQ